MAISIAAATCGARVIERHFTLDKSWKGSDHKCSLDPKEFALMCHHLKTRSESLLLKEIFSKEEMSTVEDAMKSDKKTLLGSELACMNKLGKTIVARRELEPDTVITMDDVDIKVAEPRGIDPRYTEQFIGKLTNCSIEPDEAITLKMLKCRSIEIMQYID